MSDAAGVPGAPEVTGRLVAFGAALRARGVAAGVEELLRAHRALAAVDCSSREDSRLALRCVMCHGHEDLDRFEDAFNATFGSGAASAEGLPAEELGMVEQPALPRAAVPASAPTEPEGEPSTVPAAWSDVALALDKDFAAYTTAESVAARELIMRLAKRGPTRVSRRLRPSRRRGPAIDLRALMRASLRTGGEPVERRWLVAGTRPRPVVLICDVSGSMEPYARMLMQYLHACVAARRRVEAFAFGTRLTRVTNELAGRDHDRALEKAAAAVTDMASGTRIGAALAEMNRTHGRRLGRGSVVVILSDGWDRGEPELLATEIARLRRSAHRLIWLNPLAAHPEYEPLTRGMNAAMPFVDELLAGNSLRSLYDLAAMLEEL